MPTIITDGIAIGTVTQVVMCNNRVERQREEVGLRLQVCLLGTLRVRTGSPADSTWEAAGTL